MTARDTAIGLVRTDLSSLGTAPPRLANLPALAGELTRPARVALVRSDDLGDWVLTIPLVTALLASPDVESVELITKPPFAGLLARGPVNAVHKVNFNIAGTTGHRTPVAIARRLRSMGRWGQHEAFESGKRFRGQYDVVVLPRWDTDIGWNGRPFALGTQARIVGHDPRLRPFVSRLEQDEGSLLSLAVTDARPVAHETSRSLAIAEALGVAVATETDHLAKYLDLKRTPKAGRLVVHTGANWGARRWPSENWIALIARVTELGFDDVVLIGGSEDVATHGAITAKAAARSVAGTAGLAELPDVLATASAFVGTDSGPGHVAASLGVPTLSIFAHPEGPATLPKRFMPLGSSTAIVRPRIAASDHCATHFSGCMAGEPHCIRLVEPDHVISALAALLSSVPGIAD